MYEIDPNQLAHYYSRQVGRGLNDGLLYYKSSYKRQRGAGLGSIFGAIAKKLIPFAKNILWPAAKKYVLPHATAAATNFAEDALAGKNLRDSLKDRGSEALQGIGSSAIKGVRDKFGVQSQTGGRRGMKRKRAPSRRQPKKKIRRALPRKGRKTTRKPVRKRVPKRRRTLVPTNLF